MGNINTLFSLFHQVKKEIREAVRPWSTRSLTDFRRHAQYRLKRLLLVQLNATNCSVWQFSPRTDSPAACADASLVVVVPR